MAIQRTFSIIKPDAVAKNCIGEILARYERNGLTILACRMIRFTRAQAEAIYAAHRRQPFFAEMIDFLTSGPAVISVLEGDDAVRRHRDVIGLTDPIKAAAGTIRADFGTDLGRNAVHGSDAIESARYEINCVFALEDIQERG